MNPFQNLFIFSKNQKKGAVSLIILLLLIHFFQKAYFTDKPVNPRTLHIPNLKQANSISIDSIGINTADTSDFKSLPGIGSILSTRIVRFRKAKKGFHSLKELKNVYGLSPKTYHKILPYLFLDSFPQSPYSSSYKRPFSTKTNTYPKPLPDTVNINTATKQEFQQLPGIGEVLSERIIRFREAKGGFADPSEIQKVYKLPDSTFQKIHPYLYMESREKEISKGDSPPPKERIPHEKTRIKALTLSTPVNINSADTTQWQQLPGIGPVLAKRIVAYRKIIGFFSQVGYLAKVYGLSQEKIAPLLPYLRVGSLTAYKKEDLNMLPEWKLKKYPFWTEVELNAFLLWKKKIRRVDSWQEIKSSQTVSPKTLAQLQTYFHL